MPDAYDLRGDMVRLVDELGRRGEHAWARQLDDAINAGSSSSEILGATRDVLRRLRADPSALRLSLTPRLDRAISAINRALGGRFRV